jgi:glycosyltransferase involved in cell wall biosynthesis
MKILFLNHTGRVSGAERVLLTILENLDRNRFELVVSCPEETELARLVHERDVPVVPFPHLEARFTWNPVLFIRYLVSYWRAIREFRKSPALRTADIIHANNLRAGLLASFAAIGTRIPVIWHLHDILKTHPISTVIRCIAVSMTTVSVISVSQATANGFRGRLFATAQSPILTTVLYNSVDGKRFRPDLVERQRIRQTLGLKDSQFVFAMVGQLTPRKGQMETIRAFSTVSKTISHALLLIIGAPLFNDDQRYANLLHSTVEKLGLTGRVLFLGQRSDISALLNAADGVVINSKREPFGLIVLEALAAGKPVIAARVDGIPELVDNEITGLLVPAGDHHALASALCRLSRDPQLCAALSSNGQQLVRNGFTHASYIESLEEFYRRVMRPSRRANVTSRLSEDVP